MNKFFEKRYSVRLVWLIFIILAITFLGVFIFIKYFLEWQTKDAVDYTTKIILAGLAFLTLIYHIHNLENQIETQKRSNRQNLAKYTYDICSDFRRPMMMDINEDLRILLKTKEKLLLQRSTMAEFEEYLNDEENCKYRKALILSLNYFESISAMVLAGDLDNEIVKRLFGKLFGMYYDKLKWYIEKMQEQYPRSWINFKKLVKKWKEEDSN
ncbi:hypothetical protein CMU89_17175 [Elizabethkingia anophelis]|nr:hypothetical protein [Elizabethkingia anophelis]MDV3544374.1 hypothetical protein [Elizabethkingia anophelis]